MNTFRTTPSTIALVAMLAAPPARAEFVTERSFASPDGKLTFTLERDDANNRFHWSVNRAGTAIVTRGYLGIDLTHIGTIADEGTISHVETRDVDTTWAPPYGERSLIPDHFREETLVKRGRKVRRPWGNFASILLWNPADKPADVALAGVPLGPLGGNSTPGRSGTRNTSASSMKASSPRHCPATAPPNCVSRRFPTTGRL